MKLKEYVVTVTEMGNAPDHKATILVKSLNPFGNMAKKVEEALEKAFPIEVKRIG